MAHANSLPLELTERIPQEIFNEVATFVDPVSLKSLSLVSHLWEASTRHLLFYEFQFNRRFLICFSESPEGWQRILSCIQRAHITLFFWRSDKAALLKEGLSAALPRMVKLRQLRFRQSSSEAIVLLIALLKGSEQITGLELRQAYGSFDSFQVLQGTIASLPGLEDLLVEEIWWPEDGGHNGGSVQAMVPVPRKIINLTIESMDLHVPTYGRTTSQILSWLAHGNVDSFRFMTVREVEGSGVLSKFTCVETLVLGHRWILYPPGLKTLSAFKALKKLEIGPSINLHSRTDINPSWYLDLLSSVVSPLSYLTFKLIFTGEDDLERMDWMTLNTLLQNSPFYAELRGFVIGFMRPDTPRPPPTRDDCDHTVHVEDSKWVFVLLNLVYLSTRLQHLLLTEDQRVLPWVQRARFTSVGNILGMEGELSDILRRMPQLRDLHVQNGGQSLVVLLGKALRGSQRITNLELNMKSLGWATRSFIENDRAELAAWSAVPSKRREVTIEWMERDTDTSLVLTCLSHGCADAIRFIEAEGSVVLSKFTRVETLIITGPRFTIRPPNLETLSGFKALKTLVIWPATWLLPGGHLAVQNQTWYSQFLSSLASPLSSLTFSLACTAEEQLEHMDWETLNNLLETSPFYAELKEVGVNLSLSHKVGPTSGELFFSVPVDNLMARPSQALSSIDNIKHACPGELQGRSGS
ncbi:hypothetical protein DFP72DRAFT_857043 [Ephemerocybe angulata]|uniref:F-box domain-containing protein n=1 Tax=Ephemerocybe angulata TaxID=980116 RepID=A0A8H6HD47_9AGAR|nr:hypothetical protein DFP72DRAFT_857043 [Tulosesus angulatus]